MAPLPSVRPADPAGQMRYDTIQALWRPPQKRLSREDIASAVTDFSALVRSAKDRWDAIEKDEATKAASADVTKARFAVERTLIAAAVSAAIGFGHVTILSQYVLICPCPNSSAQSFVYMIDSPISSPPRQNQNQNHTHEKKEFPLGANTGSNRLGAHQLFLLLLSKVLRDRIKEEDFTSDLVHEILDVSGFRHTPPALLARSLTSSAVDLSSQPGDDDLGTTQVRQGCRSPGQEGRPENAGAGRQDRRSRHGGRKAASRSQGRRRPSRGGSRRSGAGGAQGLQEAQRERRRQASAAKEASASLRDDFRRWSVRGGQNRDGASSARPSGLAAESSVGGECHGRCQRQVESGTWPPEAHELPRRHERKRQGEAFASAEDDVDNEVCVLEPVCRAFQPSACPPVLTGAPVLLRSDRSPGPP